jgi:hypothetical protein
MTDSIWTPEEMKEITCAGLVWYVHRLKKIGMRNYRVQVMRIRRVKNVFQTCPPLKNKIWYTDLDLTEGDWVFRDSLGGDWTRLRGPRPSGKRKRQVEVINECAQG